MSANPMLEKARRLRAQRPQHARRNATWQEVKDEIGKLYRRAGFQVTVTEADLAFRVLGRLARLEDRDRPYQLRRERMPAQQRELERDIHYVGYYDPEVIADYLFKQGWRKQAFYPAVAVQPINIASVPSVELSSIPNIADPYTQRSVA